MARTQIVGILNITPDSFSDGGEFFSKEAAIAHIQLLLNQGADMVDIGAESTRPGANALTADEEWLRLEPVINALAQFPAARFSVDTRHPETVQKIIPYGIACINDVSGFSNPDMIAAVKHSDCKLIAMHSLTVPADKAVTLPQSADVIETLKDFAMNTLKKFEAAGIGQERFIFDPGIGFGKTAKQSQTIIEKVDEFKTLGMPIFIGHSRKSFLAEFSENRDDATLEMSKYLIAKQVDYIRVHDVASHRKLLNP